MTNMAEKRRRVGTVDPPNSKKLRLSDNEDQEIWAYLKMNEFPDEVWSAFKGKTISKVCCGWIRAGSVTHTHTHTHVVSISVHRFSMQSCDTHLNFQV